ncbi:MAG: amidase domain-containing protein [Thermaerobacter sp.]|nr:amidase domain-containing protein [Thermaerobacter sp.]
MFRGWLILVTTAWMAMAGAHTGSFTAPIDRAAVENMASHVVQEEDRATMTGRGDLKGLFLSGSASAQRAYDNAVMRSVYVNDWAQARQVHFSGVSVHVRADRIHWVHSTEVEVEGADQARYQYHHLLGNSAPLSFGLGVYHRYTFKEVNGRWYIAADSFIDPLNQNTRLKGSAVPAVIQIKPERPIRIRPNSGAAKAIQFAETYCGAAPGCGNDSRYHPDYADFNRYGGDCTNFISQVLHAGGFTETRRWAWNSETEGTDAWTNATRLAQYLRSSGRADLYAMGTLQHIIKPGENSTAPLSRIRPGDLIGYFESNRVVHFAIVVSFDPDGYPLVVSHSADRYRVPWDLGWDRSTRYLLFHVHYPEASGGDGTTKDQASPKSMMSPVSAK